MPLQPQKIGFPFVQGEDTKTDPKQVITGKLLSLQNGVMTSPKQIQKRFGNTAFARSIEGGGSISAGKGIATFQNELDMMDGSSFYSYNSEGNNWDTKSANITSIETTSYAAFKNRYSNSGGSVAYHAGTGLVLVVAKSGYVTTSGGTFAQPKLPFVYSIIDSNTGEAVVSQATGASLYVSVSAKVIAITIGAYFVMIYPSLATGQLAYIAVPVATPTVPVGPVALSNDLAVPSPSFSATVLGTTGYIGWNNTDGGGGITIKSLSSALVLSAKVATADVGTTMIMFPDAVLNQVWVSYYNGANLRYFVVNSAIGSVLAPTTIEAVSPNTIFGYASNGSGQIFYGVLVLPRYDYSKTTTYTNAGVQTVAPYRFMRSVIPVTQPFVGPNGNLYITVWYQGLQVPSQGTSFVVTNFSATGSGIVSKIAPSLSLGSGGNGSVYNIGNGKYIFGADQINETIQFALTTGAVTTRYTTGVSVVQLDFSSQNTYLNVQAGNNLMVGGGFVNAYDGNSINEQNFHLYPELESADLTQSNTAAGAIANGTYQYVVTYEWMDNFGQLQISNTSVPVSFTTTGANDTVTIVGPNLRVTQKGIPTATSTNPSPVTIGVYRTQANTSGPFYKVFRGDSLTLSSVTADTWTYIDTVADATLTAFTQLYTTGGVVPNSPPPAACLLSTFNSRVFALSSENKNQFYYSQQITPGVAVNFSGFFTWNVDTAGGDITAYIQMDDKLIIWKYANIFYMVGQGPGTNGANNDFSTPQALPTDVGCVNPRSVCMTPIGAIFQSKNGWYLLDRSLSVKYIGADVEAYNARTVEKSVLVRGVTQVRTYLDSGTVIVYDYFLNQWYHDTGISTVDATIFQQKATLLLSNGTVWQENTALFTDASAFVGMSIQTSWLQFADVQGFQRLWMMEILGTYKSSHTLRVEVAYDFDPTVAQTVDIPVTSSVVPYQFMVNFTKQKCEAIRLTISDVQNGAAGESFSLSALTFYFGIKQGLKKLPAASSFA